MPNCIMETLNNAIRENTIQVRNAERSECEVRNSKCGMGLTTKAQRREERKVGTGLNHEWTLIDTNKTYCFVNSCPFVVTQPFSLFFCQRFFCLLTRLGTF